LPAAAASAEDAGGVDAVSADAAVLSSATTTPKPLNPVITVIYGNFILALATAPQGIAAIPSLTLKDIFAVSFLGVIQIGIAYILFIKGVSGGTRPLDASIIGFIEPLLNPVWVFLFVGEQPSQWAILGGAIIITTVVIHTLVQYKKKPPLRTA
jgi:drug/metabolite transporter (DMT)-like permease